MYRLFVLWKPVRLASCLSSDAPPIATSGLLQLIFQESHKAYRPFAIRNNVGSMFRNYLAVSNMNFLMIFLLKC